MDAFELDQVAAARREAGTAYHQFLNAGSLSAGLYVLPAGAEDVQEPHAEDEVYYVLAGRANLRVGNDDRAVGPGSLVFVGAAQSHRFHTITEELSLLVFFAPEHRQG